MKELFKTNPLEGKYKKAFEEAKEVLGIDDQEAEVMEQIVGLVQLMATVEKLPLEIELKTTKAELERVRDEARKLKAKVNALEEVNAELTKEKENLVGSLKAMKDLSIAEDRIENVVTLEFRR